VTGDPHIRFYAGLPLISPDNHKIGTLCVIDNVPKELSQEQMDTLQILSNQVVSLLELRFNSMKLKEASKKIEE
jgi:GAF domain-containing protein